VCFPVATNDKDSLPDDSFFEQLMKMQGTRIEDQRSSLPGKETLCTSVADSASWIRICTVPKPCAGMLRTVASDPDRHRCRSGFSCEKVTENVFKLK